MSEVPASHRRGATARKRWPRLRPFLLWLGIVLAVGLLQFTYHHLAVLAAGERGHFLKPLINELTSAFGAGLLFFGVVALVRRFPLDPGSWRRHLPLYAATIPVFSTIATSWRWVARELLYRVAGFGDYDYGLMPLRYFMELPADVLTFTIMVGILFGLRRFRLARERELRTARLERSLAETQLRNLRLQLQPHFLFNALNTISATMFDDPAAADEMLDRLAELLRASLGTARDDEVTLERELELLDGYLAILRARFGDRLRVDLEVEPGVEKAGVPSMLLQPLVENAVRHGSAERDGRGAVTIRAARRDQHLSLEVEDDGPGVPTGRDPLASGLGLQATAERLRLLYPDDHRFAAGNVDGGFRVTIRLPFRRRGVAA